MSFGSSSAAADPRRMISGKPTCLGVSDTLVEVPERRCRRRGPARGPCVRPPAVRRRRRGTRTSGLARGGTGAPSSSRSPQGRHRSSASSSRGRSDIRIRNRSSGWSRARSRIVRSASRRESNQPPDSHVADALRCLSRVKTMPARDARHALPNGNWNAPSPFPGMDMTPSFASCSATCPVLGSCDPSGWGWPSSASVRGLRYPTYHARQPAPRRSS